MSLQIFIPAEISCDNPKCEATHDLAWAVDPRDLAKQRKPFTQKQMAGIADCLTEAAVKAGWLVDRAGCYCPQCKKQIEEGELHPQLGTVTAAGLIDELRFVAKARKGVNDGI